MAQPTASCTVRRFWVISLSNVLYKFYLFMNERPVIYRPLLCVLVQIFVMVTMDGTAAIALLGELLPLGVYVSGQ